MVLNVVLLDHEENYVQFLNPNYVSITETVEKNKVKRIKFSYAMQSLSDARKLFRIGYKIWVSGDATLEDCLYVINTTVERDYFSKNSVSFEAEEIIVELNFAPLFSQTDLIQENGFTITTINDQENVVVDYNALNFWFGDYFQIGVVQDCLSNYVSRITPIGTMTKMELLRFIEDETENIFVTRYEKDLETNVIHRYLDFLNPSNNNKNWELNIEHHFYEDLASTNIALYDEDGELIEEDEIVEVTAPVVTQPVDLDIASCHFVLTSADGETIFDKTASQLGITSSMDNFKAKITSKNNQITIKIKEISYTVDEWVSGQNAPSTATEEDVNTITITANPKNNSVFTIYDHHKTWYRKIINCQFGVVHDEVLDLAYNVENIEYEIDESETYTAIAPLFDDSSKTYSKTQLDTLITQWKALEVHKGDVVPMIVQRMQSNTAPTDAYMAQSVVSSKYYSRPIVPSDSGENYEYWKASSYWKAPYTKKSGEMFVTDESLTGIDYTQIFGRPDSPDTRASKNTPKLGTVSTSDENPYAIFNDVCMKLKDKSEPKVEIEVDVANLINGSYNNYNVGDTVFIKVPGFEKLITAEVCKTEKQAHDVNKNKISLTNYSINTKVSPKITYIVGSNVAYTFPETSQLTVYLLDENDLRVEGKLINLVVYNQSSFQGSYTRVTKADGSAVLPLKLGPGEYTIQVEFAGDVEYAACEQSYMVNVGGELQTNTNTETQTQTSETYYNQYGVSPDGKSIMAIGRPSSAGENSYGYTFYKSVFQRRCPHCGSDELYWSIFWAGNETSNWGRFPATGLNEGGSAEGHIFCKKCDADYSCILGKEHVSGGRTLTRISGPERVNKTDAYTLKKGQMVYEKKTVQVETQANTNAYRANPIAQIAESVKQKALSIVGASTGLEAAKKIAAWCGPNIKYADYNNFNRSAETVLKVGSGNCCDQTRLMLQMMDAAGVTAEYQLIYVHTVGGKGGHVFAKINGTYVDPCKYQPWGNYVTGYGVPGSAPNSVYPKLPF